MAHRNIEFTMIYPLHIVMFHILSVVNVYQRLQFLPVHLSTPAAPRDAARHPLTDGLRPYSPLSTFGPSGAGVEFFFGSKRVARQDPGSTNQIWWVQLMSPDECQPWLIICGCSPKQ